MINNASHESVGVMPIGFSGQTYAQIAKACGYQHAFTISTEKELKEILHKVRNLQALSLIEIMVSLDSRKDLGRPLESARENRIQFMDTYRK